MGFQFSLAAVLRVRESVERREERALQTILGGIARTERQVEELRKAMEEARAKREQALRQTIAGRQLHSFLLEEQVGEERLKSMAEQLQVLEKQRKRQITVYQAAHRDREMLTEMLEKQRESFERVRLRDEQKRLDDIFIARQLRG